MRGFCYPERMKLAEKWQALQQTVSENADGRAITIVAATKYADVATMREAYAAGVRHFGENKVQDALTKQPHFPTPDYPDLYWHLIGSLQTNKVNKTPGAFEVIHSIDSIRLAEKLSVANTERGLRQAIFLQVDYTGSETRHGFPPSEVPEAAVMIDRMTGLTLKGLMTMAPHVDDPTVLRGVFGSLSSMRESLRADRGIDLPDLSMGMSHDFMHALKCGATIIRIGSHLFRD